jgi:Type II secretion system (T2SS), protein E, N-terminal domain
MTRLGEILLSEKVLTSSELDAALENQVLYGLNIGTCLVEMGYVTDDDLARCLGKQTGQAFLTKDQLLAFGSQNLSVIPPTVIKILRLVPVGIDGGALRIATDHKFSQKKQSEIEKILGRKIEQVAVSGYAIDCFLEKMFGIERPGRFLSKNASMKTPKNAPAVVEKVNEQAAPIVIDWMEWKTLVDVKRDEMSARGHDDISNSIPNRDVEPLSLSDATEHLSNATSRDDVAKSVLGFLTNSSGNAALVIVKHGLVLGWKAYSNRKMIPNFEAFFSTIETLPDLKQCIVTKKPYWGNSLPAETNLLMQMLHYTGEHLAFFPIVLQQRVIAVLMCEVSKKSNPLNVSELCLKASYALQILILRSKLLSSKLINSGLVFS